MQNLKSEFVRAQEAQDFLKSLSNPNKLLILCALLKEPGLSNTHISEICGISVSSTSQYLVSLTESDLIVRKKSGKAVHYYLENEKVKRVLSLLKELF